MHLGFLSRSRPVRSTLLLLCALYTVGCKGKLASADADDAAVAADTAVAVVTAHPSVGPIAEEIAADAILAPLSQAALAPRINAPIRAELVARGAHVRKGQLLLTLQDRDLQGSALESKGGLAQAQAAYTMATRATIPEDLQKAQLDVAQTRANLDVANRTADERKRLLREGAIAGRDTDTAIAAAVGAQVAFDTAVKHLAATRDTIGRTAAETAGGQLTSARGRLLSADAQTGYASLRSPINGVVTERPYFPGETPPAGTPVITVMDTSSLLAKLHLGQATAQMLRIGGSAVLHVPGVIDAQAATVSFISPTLDPGSTTVEIWLKLPNANGAFKVGTPVHSVIRGYTVPEAVQVPPAAILPAEDGSTDVLIVAPDGSAHKRAVKVGLRTETGVQIVSGVTTADTVVIAGGYGLEDGTKVKAAAGDMDGGADSPTAKAGSTKAGSKKAGSTKAGSDD